LHRKLFSVVTGLALVAGMLVFASAPAQAAKPFNIQQFQPGDQQVGVCTAPHCEADSLSDRFDGTDALAHLTAVASPDTDSVLWYVCASGFTNTNLKLSNCTQIGSDTTGVVPPIGPSASSPADEAYDTTWDIPGTLDDQTRDIVALACIGTGTDIETANANCRTDIEPNIFLEDAQTGVAANQTSSGEMAKYRTRTACFGTAPSNTACEATFKPFIHGSPVPNDGFEVKATTSDDVASMNIVNNSPSDAQTEPAAANQQNFNACTLQSTQATSKTWLCSLNPVDDAELAVWIDDTDASPAGTGGYCSDANTGTYPGAHDFCSLDMHYAVSSARTQTTVTQSFVPGGGGHTHSPPNPPAGSGCDPGETPQKSHSDTTLDDTEVVELCMLDQFSDPFVGAYTEEVTAPGDIVSCENGAAVAGTRHDHDGDGRFEHCHGTTDVGGHAYVTVSNFQTANPGTATITSCFEGQVATSPPPAAPPANHGCANEGTTLKDAVTLTWGTKVDHVLASFGPSASGDPCRGATFADGQVNDHETFTVCTIDSNGNLVPTGEDAFLQYEVEGAHGNDVVAVRFNPSPPPDETGSGGTVDVGIDDVAAGDNFITVIVRDQTTGDFIDEFVLEKQVHGNVEPRDVSTNLDARRSRRSVRFKVNSPENACVSGRQITLFMRQRGPDANLGSKTSNQFGRAGFGGLARRHTYYGRVSRSSASASNGNPLNCLPDQSNDVKIPRKRRR